MTVRRDTSESMVNKSVGVGTSSVAGGNGTSGVVCLPSGSALGGGASGSLALVSGASTNALSSPMTASGGASSSSSAVSSYSSVSVAMRMSSRYRPLLARLMATADSSVAATAGAGQWASGGVKKAARRTTAAGRHPTSVSSCASRSRGSLHTFFKTN